MVPGDLVTTTWSTDMRQVSFRDGDPGPITSWKTFSDRGCVGLVLDSYVLPDLTYPDSSPREECLVLTSHGVGWTWVHQLEAVK